MPNPVLERLLEERRQQVEFVDQLLSRVDSEGRDLVDAERNNLQAARERIGVLDDQITPLREFEELRGTADAGARNLFTPADRGQQGQGPERARALSVSEPAPWRSPGEYVVDVVRSVGAFGQQPDANAAARVQAVVQQRAQQGTGDTGGILPEPIVGSIVSVLDASRPFLTSIGVKPMGGIPGKQFSRPKITQHVQTGVQGDEHTALASRKMVIGGVDFVKATYGGYVDISRQDIDWTAPSAWDALLTDLAQVYGIDVETAAATAFATAVTQSATVLSDDMDGWSTAAYQAAELSYRGGKMLPDRMWVSLDVWSRLGAVTDVKRATGSGKEHLGSSELSSFAGNVLDLPRIVVPSFAANTAILGPSKMVEAYEETVGVISAIQPSTLGVQVAYGGYMASGVLEAAAFSRLLPPAPTVSSVSPATGPAAGGTVVTITGAGFAAPVAVKFGGTNATAVTVVSPTTITATTPAKSAGAADVTVQVNGGQVGLLDDGFTYTS